MKKVVIISIILLAIAFGAYKYFVDGGGFQEPKVVGIKNIKLVSANILSATPSVTVKSDFIMNNPNAYGLEFSKLDFDLYINNSKTSHVTHEKPINMEANSDFDLPLQLELPLGGEKGNQGIGGFLSQSLNKKDMLFKADGKVYVSVAGKDIGIPFVYQDTIKLKNILGF